MFSHTFYVVLHVFGIILTFTALGGAAIHAINGGTRETNKARGLLAAMHGIGLVIVFVAGFGLMARIGIMSTGWPLWLIGKLVIWLLLGASIVVFNRVQTAAKATLLVVIVFGLMAAYLAKFKPGPMPTAAAVEAPLEGSN